MDRLVESWGKVNPIVGGVSRFIKRLKEPTVELPGIEVTGRKDQPIIDEDGTTVGYPLDVNGKRQIRWIPAINKKKKLLPKKQYGGLFNNIGLHINPSIFNRIKLPGSGEGIYYDPDWNLYGSTSALTNIKQTGVYFNPNYPWDEENVQYVEGVNNLTGEKGFIKRIRGEKQIDEFGNETYGPSYEEWIPQTHSLYKTIAGGYKRSRKEQAKALRKKQREEGKVYKYF